MAHSSTVSLNPRVINFFLTESQVLKTLRTAEFKPYIIFVRPRVHEAQRKPLGSLSSLSLGITVSEQSTPLTRQFQELKRLFTPLLTSCIPVAAQEEDLQEMKQSAERIDDCYGHWVDYVLVKEDPASAFAELQLVLERLHAEPKWVPVSWVRHWAAESESTSSMSAPPRPHCCANHSKSPSVWTCAVRSRRDKVAAQQLWPAPWLSICEMFTVTVRSNKAEVPYEAFTTLVTVQWDDLPAHEDCTRVLVNQEWVLTGVWSE